MASAEYMRRFTAEKKRLGLCVTCKAKAVSGRRLCPKHAAIEAAKQKRYHDRKVKAGLCRHCGRRPPKTGAKSCQACITKINSYAHVRTSEHNLRGARPAVLERDGYRCRVCGLTANVVHHVDGQGRESAQPNNGEANLVTICRRCHWELERWLRWADIATAIALLERRPLMPESRPLPRESPS